MTETIDSMPTRLDQQHFAQALVEQARSEGVELIGPGGLLTGLTKTVLETALEAEITEHLGHDKHDPTGRNGGNIFQVRDMASPARACAKAAYSRSPVAGSAA